jgi:tRNA/tmRNA/rRNA uracil-C5-methylase (TrmA/RlmC/RlmD family)
MTLVGSVLELEVGGPAHGGSCVARHDGQVFFVRHALPGERVNALVTEETKHFGRADAVEIVRPSAHRVVPPCPVARPGGCGGCDWQHATAAYQRDLKAAVVVEQLRRLAGIDREVVVEPLPGDGFGWRTRVRFAVDASGRAGFRRHRSHEVVPVEECPIAHPLVESAGVEGNRWRGSSEVEVAVSAATDDRVVRVAAATGGRMRTHEGGVLHEQAAGRSWRVSPGAFWQVHPAAADALTGAVIGGLQPAAGERALDLYAGVGLFAGSLAAAVGPTGQVTAIESATVSAADAAHNLADVPQARLVRSDVAAALVDPARFGRVDVVVLDPPRSGAGAKVVDGICALQPRAIGYVACDPAALARDLATFAARGYALTQLRAFDLFPQTHHVECVAIMQRAADDAVVPRAPTDDAVVPRATTDDAVVPRATTDDAVVPRATTDDAVVR